MNTCPRTWAWDRIEPALRRSGPLRSADVAAVVYGERTDQARWAAKALLNRLARRGYVERVGWGRYALPARRPTLALATIDDAAALLRRQRYTVEQLARLCDRPQATISNWLSRLRRTPLDPPGARLRSATAAPTLWTPRRVRGGAFRLYPVDVYWIGRPVDRPRRGAPPTDDGGPSCAVPEPNPPSPRSERPASPTSAAAAPGRRTRARTARPHRGPA